MSGEFIENISILYLEDDEMVCSSVSRTLKMFTKDVYTASNGQEAIELLDKGLNVDLIITDIRMPIIDGLEFIEYLRNKKINIPVILTTAFNDLEYHKKAIDLKVDKFIVKPINLSNLVEKINDIAKDILEKKELSIKRKQLENYKNAIALTNFIIELDTSNIIINISNNLQKYLDKELTEHITFKNINEFLDEDMITEIMNKTLNLEVYNKTLVLHIKEKNFTVNLTSFASDIDNNDNIKTITFILKDISNIIKDKDEMIEKLYIDSITKLPNRQALFYDLDELKNISCLAIFDIDNFHKYTQLYGYKIANEIVRQVANKLKDNCCFEKDDKLYKIDSDKYALVLKSSTRTINEIKEHIQEMIKDINNFTFTFENMELDISVTAGVSGKDDDDIYMEASIALDVAKSKRKEYIYYDNLGDIKSSFEKNLDMLVKIKKAFEKDTIIPYFQAIYNKDGEVVKYEALARMIDPDDENNLISPYQFLDVVQNSKSNVKFTNTMIEKVFNAYSLLKSEVSINLSYEDIADPEIIDFLENKIKNSDISLTIELLEIESVKDMKLTINFCNRMKSYGVKIAIDDFGSGYSNYAYLLSMPIDIIKIDGSLVKNIDDYRGYVLLESIVYFAKNLNMQIVAEFVEDEKKFEKLKNMGIDLFQGYYFSAAKPLNELI